MKGISSIVGVIALDMGVLTTPQLHWMVRSRNKGMKASEVDYFEQISSSLRSVCVFSGTDCTVDSNGCYL